MDMILRTDATDGEIAKPKQKLMHVDREASVLEGSRLMRNSGTTELLVVDRANSALFTFGIVTAQDIVTRVIAAGLDPAVLTVGDLVWSEIAASDTVQPDLN